MHRFLLLTIFVAAATPDLHAVPTTTDESAIEWAEKAFSFADKIEVAQRRDHAFYRLTYCFARAGKINDAMRCAENVSAAQKRVYAFSFTARQAAKHSESRFLSQAISQARTTAENSENLHAHSHVVELLLEFDRVDDAIDFALSLQRAVHRNYRIGQVVTHLGLHGDVDRALALVQQHVPSNWRKGSYSRIASACASSGDVVQAERVLQRISDQKFRDGPLDAMAKQTLKSNDIEKARFLARQIADDHKRGEVLVAIAKREIEAFDDDSLQQRFTEEQEREVRIMLAEIMVKRLLGKQDFDLASEWIEKAVGVVDSEPRDAQISKFGRFGDEIRIAKIKLLHLDIAMAHHANKDLEKAIDHVETARQAIASLDDSSGLGKFFLQSRLLKTISALDLKDHFASAQTSTTLEFLKPMALAALSTSLVKEGNIEQAMSVIEDLEPNNTTGVVLGDLISALVEVDEVDRAIKLLARLQESNDIGYAYESLGRAAFKAEQEMDSVIGSAAAHFARAHICIGVSESILLPK